MEKIKNILSPGKATDDEIMYGSGRSNDPIHSGNTGALTGEGSHFDNSRDTPSGIGLGDSNIGGASTTAGPHSSNLANKADPRVDSDLDGSRTTGNTTGTHGSTARSSMPGAFEPETNPYTTQDLDPRLGGPTTSSGLGSDNTHTSYDTSGQSGITGKSNTEPTDRHFGRDAAVVGTAGAVGEGVHHHREHERDNLTTSTQTPGTYSDNSRTGNTGSTTGTQPHSSSLLNKLDPRVGSNTSKDVNDTGSGSHYGRDAALVGTAGAVGEGVHHHSENNEREKLAASTAVPATFSDNSRSGNASSATGTQPHSSNLLNKVDPRTTTNTSETARTAESEPHYGRDAAVVGGAGAVAEGVHRHRENERDNLTTSTQAPGTYSDDNRVGNTSSTTGTQPHSSSLLNKLDPRLDSNTTRAGTNTESGSHYGRDAAAVGGAAAVGEGIHHHRENERENPSSSAYSGTTPSGAGSAYYGGPAGAAISDTSGAHVTSTANRLDPAINKSGYPIERASEHNPLTGGGGLAADEAHGKNKTHLGRDAAIGAGGVGVAEHEHRKHEHEHEREAGLGTTTGVGTNTAAYSDTSSYGTATGTTGASNTAGNTGTTAPHSSKLLNKLDPRVDSSNPGTVDNSGSTHQYGRDAALGAGGVGLAEHEHRKHEREGGAGAGNRVTGSNTGVSSSTVASSNTGVGSNSGISNDNPAYAGTTGSSTHHLGRDAAVGVGGVGLAEHERRKHEHERDTGVGSGAALGSNRAAYADDPNYTRNTGTAGSTGTTDHHYGRDAAAGAGGIGLAEHEHRKHERERETGAGASTGVGSNTGLGSNTTASTVDPNSAGTNTHHYGRDAAVGAGGVGLAEHEHRKHERDRDSGIAGVSGNAAASDPSTGPAPNTAGPHSRDWMNKLDPRVDSNPNTVANTSSSTTRDTTHRERDAVAGTGLAGAGYEAEKHRTAGNEGLPSLHHTGRDASAVGAATALDESEKSRLRGVRGERDNTYNQGPVEPGYSTTATGATSRDSPYNPGYNPTTTGPMDQQSRDHHLGRDAAAAGVAGGAAYEAEKHHTRDKDLTSNEREQKRELKREEKESKIEQKEEKKHHGLLSFLHRDKNKKYTKEEEDEFDRQEREHTSHAGRDTALAGAAVGGGAAYEAEKHHGHQNTASGDLDTMKPLPVAPGNHGIGTGEGTQNALIMERKRGEGYDVDTTSGTGQTLTSGSDAYPPPGTSLGDKLHGVERNRGVNDGVTEAGYNTSGDTTGTDTHHLGRDAAVGAGGLGLAEHEHRKHEEERGTGVGSSGLNYGASDTSANVRGINTEADRSTGYTGTTAPKHNVLHKDPPANHPAARAMAGKGTDTGTTNTENY